MIRLTRSRRIKPPISPWTGTCWRVFVVTQKPEGTARPPYLHWRQCPTGDTIRCRSTLYHHISACDGCRLHGHSPSADAQCYGNVRIWCKACDINRTHVNDGLTRTPKHGHCHADALSRRAKHIWLTSQVGEGLCSVVRTEHCGHNVKVLTVKPGGT